MPLKKQQDALLKNKGREDGRHTVGVVSSLATTRPAAKLKGARPSESSYQRPLPRQHPQRGQGTRSMRLAAAGRGGGKGVGVIVQWKQPQQRMKGHDNGIRDAGIKTRREWRSKVACIRGGWVWGMGWSPIWYAMTRHLVPTCGCEVRIHVEFFGPANITESIFGQKSGV